ncbi:MAG: LL-diaminopimelate aminotransferase [Phycisphaerales bacterium]|nr:LL-diaminopimelate aminotransferase [Phycisphaerales bacterium]
MALTLPQRLQALPPYLFVEIDRKKRAAREAGKDVIDFGIGDPDQPTPQFIIERMNTAMRVPANHRYPRGDGSNEFRGAMAAFCHKRYGVSLDPDRELAAVIGTKEGIGHLPLAVLNPGDTALIPDPAYPVYFAGTLFAGGTPHIMPLHESNDWLPDLSAIPADTANRAKLMFINYPNNPTGAVAPRAFFEHVVAFARKHDIIVASDAAYNEMYFEKPAPSILEIEGAREVAIEFHSLSKTFNMTGWRLGFVAGNAEVVAALARIKSNLDSGPFTAIQEAGIEAYHGIERPEIAALRGMYRERAAALSDGLAQFGFRVRPLQATFYLWVGVPRGYTSMSLATKLLDEAAVVCIPGTGFGAYGEGYVRFALTVDADRTCAALERLSGLRW